MTEILANVSVPTDFVEPPHAIAADVAHLLDTYGVADKFELDHDKVDLANRLERKIDSTIEVLDAVGTHQLAELLGVLSAIPTDTCASGLAITSRNALTRALYEFQYPATDGFPAQVNEVLDNLGALVEETPATQLTGSSLAAVLTPRYMSQHVVQSELVEQLLPHERRIALLAALGAAPDLGVQRDTINAPLALALHGRPEIAHRFGADISEALVHHLDLVCQAPDALTTPDAHADEIHTAQELYDRLAFAKGTATTPSSERYIDGVAPSSHVLLQADPDLWVARADADWLTTMSTQLDALDTQGLLSAETRHALARHRVATTPLAILVSDETRLATQGWPMIGALVEHIGMQRPLGEAGPGLDPAMVAKVALAIGRTIASAPVDSFAADAHALSTMQRYLDTLTPASVRPSMFSSATIDHAVRTGLSRSERRQLSSIVGEIRAKLSL